MAGREYSTQQHACECATALQTIKPSWVFYFQDVSSTASDLLMKLYKKSLHTRSTNVCNNLTQLQKAGDTKKELSVFATVLCGHTLATFEVCTQ